MNILIWLTKNSLLTNDERFYTEIKDKIQIFIIRSG